MVNIPKGQHLSTCTYSCMTPQNISQASDFKEGINKEEMYNQIQEQAESLFEDQTNWVSFNTHQNIMTTCDSLRGWKLRSLLQVWSVTC